MSDKQPEAQKQVDIAQIPLVELKALAFDLVVQRDRVIAELSAIYAEIQKRGNA